jgi:hypothetical protein
MNVIYLAIDWNMWGALGQWAGAIFTAIAVAVALWQVIEMKKQENKKNQQKGIIRFSLNDDKDQLEVILTNANVASIFVNKANLYRISEDSVRKQIGYEPIEDQRIQSEAHKLISQGDICKMTVPLDVLIDEVEKNNQMFYSAYFFSSSGGFFRRSLYVETKQGNQLEIYIPKDDKQIETQDLNEMELWETIVLNKKKVIASIASDKFFPGININIARDPND